MLTDDTEISSPTALVYETTEEARLLLADALDDELAAAGRAAGEAAYYLSDTIEPEERTSLLTVAVSRLREGERQRDPDAEARATEALSLMSHAAGEVEELLRGPNASSELRIGLRALHRAIAGLADRLGIATNHLDVGSLRSQALGALRRGRSRRAQQRPGRRMG